MSLHTKWKDNKEQACESSISYDKREMGSNGSSKSETQSYFTTGGLQPISSSWRQAPWDSRPVILFQLNTCGHSPYVTSSLTIGWVCSLQFLLALASAVIFRSESRGNHDHILLSQIRDSPKMEARIPYLYIPGTGWPSCIRRHWVLVTLPPTTRRFTV
jgi:hypothetical protein